MSPSSVRFLFSPLGDVSSSSSLELSSSRRSSGSKSSPDSSYRRKGEKNTRVIVHLLGLNGKDMIEKIMQNAMIYRFKMPVKFISDCYKSFPWHNSTNVYNVFCQVFETNLVFFVQISIFHVVFFIFRVSLIIFIFKKKQILSMYDSGQVLQQIKLGK